MPTPQSTFWDQPIDFWEKSPVRRVVDLAFDAVVIRTKQRFPIDDSKEQTLRERILPVVFLSITERIDLFIDEEGNILEEHRSVIEAEIEAYLVKELTPRV